MKKVVALLCAAAVLSLASAAPVPKEKPGDRPYFPTQVGAKWVYRTDDRGEEGVEVSAVETGDGEVIVKRAAVGQNTTVYADVGVSSRGLRSAVDDSVGKPVWLLKTPFETGDKWVTPKGEKRSVHGPERVAVPAGTYTAVRVEVEQPDGGRTLHWYVAGMGEVKRVHRAEDGAETVRRALVSFTPGKD